MLEETADILSKTNGVDSTNIVTLNSNPKVSPIVKKGSDYYYNFNGVEPRVHTLTVLNNDGTKKAENKIVIKKGTEAGVGTTIVDGEEVQEITITENHRSINITTDVVDNMILNSNATVSVYNPYDNNKETLAYNIINNAILNKNGTEFLTTPKTTPLLQSSKYEKYYLDGIGDESYSNFVSCYGSSLNKYYVTYGDSYTYDSSTQEYTIINFDGSTLKTMPISRAFTELIGYYVVSFYNSSSTPQSAKNLNYIYRIEDGSQRELDTTTNDWICAMQLRKGLAENEKYVTYYDSYEFNSVTGKYSLKNNDGSPITTVKYKDNIEMLKNKYFVYSFDYTSEVQSYTNKDDIYRFTENTDEYKSHGI